MKQQVQRVDLATAYEAWGEGWGAHAVADMNDYEVRIAKIQGEFHWHSHANSDELYIVTSGRVRMQVRDQEDIVLTAGQLVVIPRGVEHCPHAEEPSNLLLVWPSKESYR